ncbi:PD-(D/E)XK nuclease family protein [Candidatus Roizmanbacteria bacterium]|nr:PD-(D/E)XK nuclease family protein [Candidatus Roizmanbacteria bacterium]
MAEDKYTAVWVSHTSIGDFLKCPNAYYLKHIYRNPDTGHKIKLMSPSLALGQAVHEVIESLSVLPVDSRFNESLILKFNHVWKKVSGARGGFFDPEVENKYKLRGEAMLNRVAQNPGILKNQAVKIKMDLPHYWLSPEANIILCGKIDWLEYLPTTNSVHIVDFKTSKNDEDPNSLQLPIYHLLVHNCQKRTVTKASYWYLDRNDIPTEKQLPDLETANEKILEIAKQIKLARQLERFKCSHKDGCFACRPLQKVLRKEAALVGTDEYNQDIFVMKEREREVEEDSVIL